MVRLLTCALALALTASLHAQQIRMNAPKFALLINDAVAKELKLTADQQEKIKGVFGDCLQEVDGQKRLVMRGQTDMESLEADCMKVLTDKQAKRLREALATKQRRHGHHRGAIGQRPESHEGTDQES